MSIALALAYTIVHPKFALQLEDLSGGDGVAVRVIFLFTVLQNLPATSIRTQP